MAEEQSKRDTVGASRSSEEIAEQMSRSLGASTSTSTTTQRGDGCCYRLLMRPGRIHDCLFAWPRMTALFLGVIAPLFFLIFLSFIFGFILASFEAPNEIKENDSSLAQQATEQARAVVLVEAAGLAPSLCFQMFVTGKPAAEIKDALLATLFGTDPPDLSLETSNSTLLNSTELQSWMVECGKDVAPFVIELLRNGTGAAFITETGDTITLNWIRCLPGSNGTNSRSSKHRTIEELQPETQREHYVKTWEEDQQRLLNASLTNLSSSGTEPQAGDIINALRRSYAEATGGSGCELNVAASAWFWFTVLTTVGYGNQAPLTGAGRALVFTLGFISILAFAGILAASGYIASACCDDLMVRLKVPSRVRSPWGASLVWAMGCYGWMAAIAAAAMSWKRSRLGEDFDMESGYWFAYISSTTVGLGDIYFEPEVFLGRDLITFPLLFLIGFVLVSAFLQNFSRAIGSLTGKQSAVQALIETLKKTDMGIVEMEDVQAGIGNAVESAGRKVNELFPDQNRQASSAGDDSQNSVNI